MRLAVLLIGVGLFSGIAAYFGGFATVLVTWPLSFYIGWTASEKGWV